MPENRKESVVPLGRASSAVSRPISPVATNSSAKCVCNTSLSKMSPSSCAASSCYTATFRPSACGTGIESSRSVSTCSSINSSMSLKSIEFPSPSRSFSNNSRSDSPFDVAESGVQQNPTFFALCDQRPVIQSPKLPALPVGSSGRQQDVDTSPSGYDTANLPKNLSAPSNNPSVNGSKNFDDFASLKQSESLATAGPFSNSRHESESSFRMVGSGLQNPTYLAQRDQRFGASARTSGLVGGNAGDFSQSVLQPYFCCEGSAPSSENNPSRSAGPAATQSTASGNARSACNSFNPCGSLLAVGCNDGRVIFFDFITLGAAKTICAHNGPICTISWSRNGRKVVTASTDNTVAIWDVLSGDCVKRFRFPGPVLQAQFHPRDEKRLLVSPLNHAAVLLNLSLPNSKSMQIPIIEEDELSPNVNIIASFDRNGNHVITGNGKGKVCVFATDSLQVKASFRLPSNHAVKLITVCRRTDFFLTLSQDCAIREYSIETVLAKGISGEAEPVQKLQDLVNKTPWKTCCFSGDSEYVCAASASHHSVYIWERNSGSLVKILHGTKREQLLDLTWHPLRPVICSIANGVVTIWAQSHAESWSAFAPDFKELDENAEYEERESEFDLEINGTILEFTGKHVTRKHGDVAFAGLNPSAEEQSEGTEELTESGIDLILNHAMQESHVVQIEDDAGSNLDVSVLNPETAAAWRKWRTVLFGVLALFCLGACIVAWVGHKQDVPYKLMIDRTSNMSGHNFNYFPAIFNTLGFISSLVVAFFSGFDSKHKTAFIFHWTALVFAFICIFANFSAGGLSLKNADEPVDRTKYSREEYEYQIDQHKLTREYAFFYVAPGIVFFISFVFNVVSLRVDWDAYLPPRQQQQPGQPAAPAPQLPPQPPPQPQAPPPQPAAQEQIFKPPKMTVNRPPSPRYPWAARQAVDPTT